MEHTREKAGTSGPKSGKPFNLQKYWEKVENMSDINRKTTTTNQKQLENQIRHMHAGQTHVPPLY